MFDIGSDRGTWVTVIRLSPESTTNRTPRAYSPGHSGRPVGATRPDIDDSVTTPPVDAAITRHTPSRLHKVRLLDGRVGSISTPLVQEPLRELSYDSRILLMRVTVGCRKS